MFNGITFQPYFPGDIDTYINLLHSDKDSVKSSIQYATISELRQEVSQVYSQVMDSHTRLKMGRVKTLVSSIRINQFTKHYLELIELLDKHSICPTTSGVKTVQYAVELFGTRYAGLINKYY